MIKKLNFIPSLHGFHFNNEFTTHIGAIKTRGLCGGLSLGAFNYYRNNFPVPTHHQDPNDFSTTDGLPAEGGRLRTMLLNYQILTFASAAPFIYLVPDENVHFDWSMGEFNLVKNHIDNGRFVLLGLRSGFAAGHQVLAYGYDDTLRRVFFYDCNHPEVESVIDLNQVTKKLDHKNHTAGDTVNSEHYLSYFVQLPLDPNSTDIWTGLNKPSYFDLGLSAGLTVQGTTEPRRPGMPLTYTARVRNFGESPARVSRYQVYVRDPLGNNHDMEYGFSDQTTLLAPGAERVLTRTISSFANMPGVWEIGVKYISHEGHEIMMPTHLTPNAQNKVMVNVSAAAPVNNTIWLISGSGVASDPTAIKNQDGTTEVFVRTQANTIARIRETAANDYTGLQVFPGDERFDGNVAAVLNQSDKLEIFVKGRDNALRNRYQNNPNVASLSDWSGWGNLGGNLKSDPAATRNLDKRLEVFAIHQDDRIYKNYHRIVGGWWSGWEDMSGTMRFKGTPSALPDAAGRIHVVARGFDDTICINFQLSANGPYNGWMLFGGVATADPVLMKHSDGRLEIVVRGTDGKPYHRFQSQPNGSWTDWGPFRLNNVHPVMRVNGKADMSDNPGEHPQLVLTESNFNVKATRRVEPNPNWANWRDLAGNVVSNPAVVRKRAPNTVEVFGVNAQAQLIRSSFTI